MAVSYPKAMREAAKAQGRHLVSVAVRGLEFQGPVSEEESERLLEYLTGMLARRRAELKTAATSPAPAAG